MLKYLSLRILQVLGSWYLGAFLISLITANKPQWYSVITVFVIGIIVFINTVVAFVKTGDYLSKMKKNS